MARDNAPGPAGLSHHYAHVLVAINETRKGMEPKTEANQKAADALDNTISGLCGLIDTLVAQEHKDQAKSGVTHS